MKFPVDKCLDCGLDLTTAEPAEVRYFDNRMATGTCPGCLRTYFMTEVAPPPSPEPESISEPEPEPEVTPEPESAPETEPEPALEPGPETEAPSELEPEE